jgi:type IV pilus biogenesis protein CpaD/CtpE
MAGAAHQVLEAWTAKIPHDAAEAAAVLADCAHRDGDHDGAKRYAAEAWAAIAEGRPKGDWFVAAQEARIARSLLQEGMLKPAEELLTSAYEMLRVQLGNSQPDTRTVKALLDEVHVRSGNIAASPSGGEEDASED